MIVARTKGEIAGPLAEIRARGERLALVPTMGFLHEGHLSLVRRARELADRVALTIFVNPAQFGPNEDLDRYPRDLEGDLEKCRKEGVWMVFAPSDPGEVYRPGHSTWVNVEGPLVEGLCGARRPGHFRGVATVVLKLFHLFGPDVALFGKKDYQQLAVIRKMVEDLDLSPGLRIVAGDTVREPDGLALSSRNAYLSAEERVRALSLHRGLSRAKAAFEQGERSAAALLEAARAVIEPEVDRIDYLELVDAGNLTPVAEVGAPACLLVAAFVGKTRLIDNVELG
jgi:pantoate--beta-alanine ligase